MADMIDVERKKVLIKKHSFFAKLNDKEIEELSDLFNEKLIPAGETIVVEGEAVDYVYLIVNGTADVRHLKLIDGKIHTQSVATLNPGDAIGLNETGFYSLSGKRTATVVSNTDMLLLSLKVPAFHGFALANPRVNELMHKNAKDVLS